MADKTTPKASKEQTVYASTIVMAVKLQLAGYEVKTSQQMTIHGKKQFMLVGETPLEVEALNEKIAASARATGDPEKAKRMIAKYTMSQEDIDSGIYLKPKEPSKDVVMKRAEEAKTDEKLKERRLKKSRTVRGH